MPSQSEMVNRLMHFEKIKISEDAHTGIHLQKHADHVGVDWQEDVLLKVWKQRRGKKSRGRDAKLAWRDEFGKKVPDLAGQAYCHNETDQLWKMEMDHAKLVGLGTEHTKPNQIGHAATQLPKNKDPLWAMEIKRLVKYNVQEPLCDDVHTNALQDSLHKASEAFDEITGAKEMALRSCEPKPPCKNMEDGPLGAIRPLMLQEELWEQEMKCDLARPPPPTEADSMIDEMVETLWQEEFKRDVLLPHPPLPPPEVKHSKTVGDFVASEIDVDSVWREEMEGSHTARKEWITTQVESLLEDETDRGKERDLLLSSLVNDGFSGTIMEEQTTDGHPHLAFRPDENQTVLHFTELLASDLQISIGKASSYVHQNDNGHYWVDMPATASDFMASWNPPGYTRVEDQAAMTHASDHVSWANPKFVSIAGGGQLEYSGALFKKGTGHSLFGRRNWKLRHFELNMHHAELLYFAPNSKDNGAHGKASPPPLGTIPLASCELRLPHPKTTPRQKGGDYGRWFQFCIWHSEERCFELRARNFEEMKTWIRVLTKAIAYLAATHGAVHRKKKDRNAFLRVGSPSSSAHVVSDKGVANGEAKKAVDKKAKAANKRKPPLPTLSDVHSDEGAIEQTFLERWGCSPGCYQVVNDDGCKLASGLSRHESTDYGKVANGQFVNVTHTQLHASENRVRGRLDTGLWMTLVATDDGHFFAKPFKPGRYKIVNEIGCRTSSHLSVREPEGAALARGEVVNVMDIKYIAEENRVRGLLDSGKWISMVATDDGHMFVQSLS